MPYTTPAIGTNPGRFHISVHDATNNNLYAYVEMDFDGASNYSVQDAKDFYQRIIDLFDSSSDFANVDGQVQYFAGSTLTAN
jgi:hypothetical protein